MNESNKEVAWNFILSGNVNLEYNDYVFLKTFWKYCLVLYNTIFMYRSQFVWSKPILNWDRQV